MNDVITKNLIIRDFSSSDEKHIRSLAVDADVMKYLMVFLDTEEQIQGFVADALSCQKKDPRTLYLPSFFEKESGSFIGTGIIDVDSEHPTTAEIGYIIARNFWGKGYATEAARALTEYCFKKLKMHRVFGKCDELNSASAHVLEKCGMKYEGTVREHVWLRDHWRSSRYYGILADEFAGSKN